MRHLLSLAAMAGRSAAVGLGQDRRPGTLDLCAVAGNIQAYAGHRVRVSGVLSLGPESAVLYDPKCQGGKPLVWVEFKPKVAGQMKGLRRLVKKKTPRW